MKMYEYIYNKILNKWIKQIALCLNKVHSLDGIFGNLTIKNIYITPSLTLLLPLPSMECNIDIVLYPPEYLFYNKFNKSFDIWSLGIIIYQLLYNSLPFTDKSDILLYHQGCYNLPNDNPYSYFHTLLKGLLQVKEENRLTLNELLDKLNYYHYKSIKRIIILI